MIKNLFPFLMLFVLVSSCSKTETVIKVTNENKGGNVPPPDYTIDSAVLSIYVNKAYINLLGHEPSPSEKVTALAILRQHNFSADDRKQFIATFFSKDEYISTLYTVANSEYLRDLDTAEIGQQVYLFNYFLTQPQYAPFYSYIQIELYRLDTLQMILPMMRAGTMDYRAMLSRMTNNYFYDQINMGSENFVVSMYQNFLFRYPSNTELATAKVMVDGNTSTAFFKTGKSKYDFINIFFGTDDYFEGQVRFIFKKYLFREPSSAEVYFYSNIYKSTNDYTELEKAVFTMDEYAGIH